MNSGTQQWTKIYPHEVPDHSHQHTPTCPKHRAMTIPNIIPGRYAHSCCWYNNKIYMYGGRNDFQFFHEVECFDPGMC